MWMAASGGGQSVEVVVVVMLQPCPRSVNLEPAAWHGRAASARGLSILLASGVPRALGLLKPAAANTCSQRLRPPLLSPFVGPQMILRLLLFRSSLGCAAWDGPCGQIIR
jgi:hypothetical protein